MPLRRPDIVSPAGEIESRQQFSAGAMDGPAENSRPSALDNFDMDHYFARWMGEAVQSALKQGATDDEAKTLMLAYMLRWPEIREQWIADLREDRKRGH